MIILLLNPFIDFLEILGGFLLGCLIAELDWRYSHYWDSVRPRKKKKS
jgi:hypothetical protein